MDLAKRIRSASVGLLLGALAGFLVDEFGVGDLIAWLGSMKLMVAFMGIGATLGAVDRLPILASFDGLLLFAYFVAGWTPLASAISHSRVRADSIPGQVDAIVVLSSGLLSNGALEVHGLDRILTGVDLLNRRVAPRIVTTRVRSDGANGQVSSDDDQRRFIAFATPAPRWDVVDSVYSTRDEATGSARLLLPQEARRIAVVTSPMHTRRACATFERLGFVVTCVPAREHGAVTVAPNSPHDRLAALREAVYEMLGTAKYRAKGWIGR
jgi:uncharacterized SAM-binding protein YcdF (DUF218 family)